MNDNVGTKLKKIAIVLFVLSIILFVVVAIINFIADQITYGVLYLVIGIVTSLFEYYIIYAIGDTNEKVTAYQYQLVKMNEELKKIKTKLNENSISTNYSNNEIKNNKVPPTIKMKKNVADVIEDNFSSVSFKKSKLLQMYNDHNITEEEYDEAIGVLEQNN